MSRAIGIDLGTTNSCAAYVVDGVPTVITYPDGSKTIPSVFAIDKSGKRLVGKEAKEQAAANPENTIAAAKRLIGRSFDSKAVEQMSQVFTYELLEGEGNAVLIKVANQVLTLEQVSAAILMRICENAERFLGEEVTEAVITVPAYFNDRQRQAVRAAGKLAGLKVLRVLNEPTAAALAYGLGRTLNQRVAIYDLGGGTFDISIIDIKDKVFEVIATGGDTFLGGVDFDDRLMQHILKEFLRTHDIDLSYDRTAITLIRDAAETAKIELSSQETSRIFLEAICETEEAEPRSIDLDMEITRELLEQLTGDLVERSIQTCARIFQEAATLQGQIDELLIVGGQSRMPLVRRSLEAFLGRQPSDTVHPDEAVAIGAAIMASSLSNKQVTEQKDVTLLDVLPVPIGLVKPNGGTHVLFPKNEPLPARAKRTITTSKDAQRTLVIRMYQGEADHVDDCELLGAFTFYGLREAPKGEVRLDITFHIDSEGILNVTAADKDTGDELKGHIDLAPSEEDAASRKKRKQPKKKEEPEPPPELEMPVDRVSPVESIDELLPQLDPEVLTPEPPSTQQPPAPTPPPEPEPPRDMAALRKLMNRPVAPEPDLPAKKAGGFWAWLRRLFGLS
jgi:molecular chaperone DnaK